MKLTVEIEVPEPRIVALDSTKTAIVVIDMENEFCAPGGKKFIGSPAEEAVRAAAALIQRGRQRGVPVLWVRSVRETGALEFTAFKQTTHLMDGTWAVEYTSPLEVLDGEPCLRNIVMTVHSYGPGGVPYEPTYDGAGLDHDCGGGGASCLC